MKLTLILKAIVFTIVLAASTLWAQEPRISPPDDGEVENQVSRNLGYAAGYHTAYGLALIASDLDEKEVVRGLRDGLHRAPARLDVEALKELRDEIDRLLEDASRKKI